MDTSLGDQRDVAIERRAALRIPSAQNFPTVIEQHSKDLLREIEDVGSRSAAAPNQRRVDLPLDDDRQLIDQRSTRDGVAREHAFDQLRVAMHHGTNNRNSL